MTDGYTQAIEHQLDEAKAEIARLRGEVGRLTVAKVRAEAEADRLGKQVERVRDLHSCLVYEDADRCACQDKSAHRVGHSPDGDELCLDSPEPGETCCECVDDLGYPLPWPCQTIRIIDGTP